MGGRDIAGGCEGGGWKGLGLCNRAIYITSLATDKVQRFALLLCVVQHLQKTGGYMKTLNSFTSYSTWISCGGGTLVLTMVLETFYWTRTRVLESGRRCDTSVDKCPLTQKI